MMLNERYYYWDDDSIEEYRICRINNENSITVIKTAGSNIGERKKINPEELKQYKMLRPDGYISFNIALLSKNIKDVVVTVSTKNDIVKGISEPYAVCRQCVIDLFAKQLSKEHEDITGISISRDTCPADVDFKNFFACDDVEYSEIMAFYIGDKLDDIVSLVKKPALYDNVLQELFNDHCMFISNNNKYIAATYKKKRQMDGYCKNLVDLLKLNNFEYDLLRAFDIIPTDFTEDDFKEGVLSSKASEVLSAIINSNIDKSIVIKYDKDIDLSETKRKTILLSDKNGTVWVVGYTTNGKYIVPVEYNESDDNITKLANLMPTDSVALAYQHLKFNKEKFE